MPIYEYKCTCGNRFETIVFRTEGTETAACPSCEAEAPRALSAFAVGADRAGAAGCASYGQTCGGQAGCAAAAKN